LETRDRCDDLLCDPCLFTDVSATLTSITVTSLNLRTRTLPVSTALDSQGSCQAATETFSHTSHPDQLITTRAGSYPSPMIVHGGRRAAHPFVSGTRASRRVQGVRKRKEGSDE
jgi:hypothetical protein